jgi:hypothetical protein
MQNDDAFARAMSATLATRLGGTITITPNY